MDNIESILDELNGKFKLKNSFSPSRLPRTPSLIDGIGITNSPTFINFLSLSFLNFTDYDQHKTPEISNRLEEYIGHLAKTGETLFPWLKIRGVLRHKLELVMANFKEICPTENLPPCPNVDPFQFETVRDKILEQFDSFTWFVYQFI